MEVIMTQSRKRALFTLIIWGLVFISFALVFFIGGGPKMFSEVKWRRGVSAIPIALGYLLYYLMLYLTRDKTGNASVLRDERDEIIQNKANSSAFILVLIITFIFSLTLFEKYHDEGMVPVAWLWFMSYSIICIGFISASLCALFIESRMSQDAQS
jgi:hypothetical protein